MNVEWCWKMTQYSLGDLSFYLDLLKFKESIKVGAIGRSKDICLTLNKGFVPLQYWNFMVWTPSNKPGGTWLRISNSKVRGLEIKWKFGGTFIVWGVLKTFPIFCWFRRDLEDISSKTFFWRICRFVLSLCFYTPLDDKCVWGHF